MDSPTEDSSIVDSPSNDTSPDTHLSRAVSAVDLNASLAAVKEQPDQIPEYNNKDTSITKHNSQNDAKPIEGCSLGGILTPPDPNTPNPPPPTPATAQYSSEVTTVNEQIHNDHDTVPSTTLIRTKKKKKNKRAGPKKQPATGFEEFFADPPIRPDQHAEELDLYDPSREFKDRMQGCIQRFRSCRKLDSVRANVFTKYLAYGGVETGVKQFTGGLDRETIENSTASEIAAMQATDFIRTDSKSSKFYDGSDSWVVDFESVAKGFFSHYFPHRFPLDSEKQLQGYCAVIKNFLNYVLYHKVCPEYTEDVIAARKITELAEKELWSIEQISSKIPGNFNLACSILFGGRYMNLWGCGSWDNEDHDNESSPSAIRDFNKARAELIFTTVISITEKNKNQSPPNISDICVKKTSKKYLEVIGIEYPDAHTIEEYGRVKDSEGKPANVKPLGTIKTKRWTRPEFEQEDYTDDESREKDNHSEIESYFLEVDLLQIFFLSLKLEVCVKELNIGIKFIDSFVGLFCSFYTLLPNERMIGYKEPAPTNRPPPTEDDPDAEEAYHNSLEEDF